MRSIRPGRRSIQLPADEAAEPNAPQRSPSLTGPGLIRLPIRGRNGGLESHQQIDASVVYEGLKC